MNFLAVLASLNDLPDTFRKSAPPYTQIIDSLASSLALLTAGEDATINQVSTYGIAVDGWLDVWGLLFGVPRNQNEANTTYTTRIRNTVLAWVGTVPAIQAWMDVYAPGGTVTENSNGFGYVLTFPANMTQAQIRDFVQSLRRIRPIGVPFNGQQSGIGLFLGTDIFMGLDQLAGSYLTGGLQSVGSNDGATTLSSQTLLPTLYLFDPTINPSLAT